MTSWKGEFPLTLDGISNAPDVPGVYRIKQSEEYWRYKGFTRVLKIGKSDKSLQEELRNHLNRHTAANRIKRIKNDALEVTLDYKVLSSDNTDSYEKELLRNSENEHWDLLALNSTRGYKRREYANMLKGKRFKK